MKHKLKLPALLFALTSLVGLQTLHSQDTRKITLKEAIDLKLKEEGKTPMTDQHEPPSVDSPNGIAIKPTKGQEFEEAPAVRTKRLDDSQ